MSTLTDSMSALHFANWFLPTREYAEGWRERYWDCIRKARDAKSRKKAILYLSLAASARRYGWMLTTDRANLFRRAADVGNWDWESLVGKNGQTLLPLQERL